MSEEKDSWPSKKVAFISQSPGSLQIMKELLGSLSWACQSYGNNFEDAVSAIKNGHVFFLIIDEQSIEQSFNIIKSIYSDHFLLSTPVLLINSKNSHLETSKLISMGFPHTYLQPISPSKFLPHFIKLVTSWETKDFALLRACNYHYIKGNIDKSNDVLIRLLGANSNIRYLASQVLVLRKIESRDLKFAERLLLDTLKHKPHNIGLLLTLANFYMQFSMPKLAKRVLQTAYKGSDASLALLPELIQANIMLSEYSEAISSINKLAEKHLWIRDSIPILVKLLMIRGSMSTARNVLSKYPEFSKKIIKDWDEVNHSISKAG